MCLNGQTCGCAWGETERRPFSEPGAFMKKINVSILLILCLGALNPGRTTAQFPVTVTDQTPFAPLASPVPTSYQPRYISGFGSDNHFTVFFEDRDALNAISSVTTLTGPAGFPGAVTGTNITDTHFCIKDWPIHIAGTDYAYRAWASVGNNASHHFYVSNDLVNWTLVSTFVIPNDPGFTNANGFVYYGFHDVILVNGTYYAFGESNGGQTMICRSAGGDDNWTAFASIGGETGDGPLELPSGVTAGWTPTGNFFDLGHDRGMGKIYADPQDAGFFLAVNEAAKTSLSPADLEAAFLDPANWTWHDGTTGPAAAYILSETAHHDLRECWLVPATSPDADMTIVYDANYPLVGTRALGYASMARPLHTPVVNVTSQNSPEIYRGGGTYPVTWSSSQPGTGTVSLRYSTDGGATFPHIIANNLPNNGYFQWMVPHINSGSVRVRVEITGAPAASDENDIDFIIDSTAPHVELLSPLTGDSLPSGGSWDIRWYAVDNFGIAPDGIDINYSLDGGYSYPYQIAVNEPNDGVYHWRIPGDLLSGAFMIKVKAWDRAGNSSCGHMNGPSAVLPLGLAIVTPAGGEILAGNSLFDIRWSSGIRSGIISISFSRDGGRSYPDVIAENETNDGHFLWNVPGINTGSTKIKIVCRGAVQETVFSDSLFTIDSTPPEVTVLYPNGGENLKAGDTCTIRWLAQDNFVTDDASVDISLSQDHGATFTESLGSGLGNTGEYRIIWPENINSDEALIRVKVTDMAGMTGTGLSDTPFSVRPLGITFISPGAGSALRGGSIEVVRWSSSVPGETVDLSYSTDGGMTFPHVIAARMPANGATEWLVPEINNRNVRLRLTSNDAQKNKATVYRDIIIDSTPPEARIISPRGGERIEAGSEYVIEWAAEDNMGLGSHPLCVLCSRDNGDSYADTLYRGTKYRGTMLWKTETAERSSRMKLRLEVQDNARWISADETDSCLTVAPVDLLLTSPADGTMIQGNTCFPVLWECNFMHGTADIHYSTDGGISYPFTIVENTENDGMHNWHVPGMHAGNVKIRLTLTTLAASKSVVSSLFRIHYAPPVVRLFNPQSGDIWEAGSGQWIAWRTDDAFEPAENAVTLTYSLSGQDDFSHIIAENIDADSMYCWQIPGTLVAEQVRIGVEVTGSSGLKGYARNDGFLTIVNPPPVVRPFGDRTFSNDKALYLDLNNYVSDKNDDPCRIRWRAETAIPAIQVYINDNNSACTIIAPGYSGNGYIIFTAIDPYGASGQDTLSVIVTGNTEVTERAVLPLDFSLSQNYPNPFNPETTFRFGLPEQTDIGIYILNMQGEQLEKHLTPACARGFHDFVWNASHYPSGVYFVLLKTADWQAIRKCILMK